MGVVSARRALPCGSGCTREGVCMEAGGEALGLRFPAVGNDIPRRWEPESRWPGTVFPDGGTGPWSDVPWRRPKRDSPGRGGPSGAVSPQGCFCYRIISAALTSASYARKAWRASHRRMKATSGRQAANATWNVKPVIST